MNRILKDVFYMLLMISSILIGCQSSQDKTKLIEKVVEVEKEKILSKDEQKLKAIIEKFLMVAGNYDLEAMDTMISDKANIGIAIVRDGVWKNSVITINEYFESTKSRELGPYYEPVKEFKFLINKEQVAFVWADAIMHSFGVARTNNIDNFTLIKENEEWKIINISFTNTRLPDEQRIFDMEIFAKSYAQVWSGVRPEFVAMFFEEEGSLHVNDAAPAIGRDAIANVAKGFMTDLPDMVVRYDSLVTNATGTEFHWTLIANNSGPGGTGKKVKVSGFELWEMSENGRILSSKGHFPTEEYNRQLGIEN